jgi:hypothetical protein
LKHGPQIILGFFHPDPVLLAKQGAEQGLKNKKIAKISGIGAWVSWYKLFKIDVALVKPGV